MRNKNKKLPYIPDKKMYAAVMGACSYVRDTGYFNKATSYYADKYDVDVEEVRRYVRIAQGNGQRQKEIAQKRKYYWYAVEYSLGNERNGCAYFQPLEARYDVKKGLTRESVKATMSKNDDYLSEYAPVHWFGRVEGFNTRKEAVEKIQEWREAE